MRVLVLYDITEDKVRNRIINACKDYGLERIQFSCFMGILNNNYIDELSIKLDKLLAKKEGRIHIFPFAENIATKMIIINNIIEDNYDD